MSSGSGDGALVPIALIAIIALIASSGEKQPSIEKEGPFKIRGIVEYVGERSVKIRPTDILTAEGGAARVFKMNGQVVQVHNGYHEDTGWVCEQKDIGEAYDAEGHPETLKDVRPQDSVELSGELREWDGNCSDGIRPVYRTLREIGYEKDLRNR